METKTMRLENRNTKHRLNQTGYIESKNKHKRIPTIMRTKYYIIIQKSKHRNQNHDKCFLSSSFKWNPSAVNIEITVLKPFKTQCQESVLDLSPKISQSSPAISVNHHPCLGAGSPITQLQLQCHMNHLNLNVTTQCDIFVQRCHKTPLIATIS